MGCSCFDVKELSEEAKNYFFKELRNMGHSYCDSIVNSKSLEQMNKEIEEYQSLLNKLRKMSSSDYVKQGQIHISTQYIFTKLKILEDLRIAKINLLKAKEIDRKIDKMQKAIINLYNLFPQNYFLPKRGKDKYIPPNWENLDFNIKEKYKDDNYLLMNNNNEWIKAYHGTGRNCKSDSEIYDMIDNILKQGIKNGINNAHSNCDDKYHPGRKIGIGVYVTPIINTAKLYAGTIHKDGEKYLTIFLVRVKKSAIRGCNCPDASDYWVVDGSSDEIRPISAFFTFTI